MCIYDLFFRKTVRLDETFAQSEDGSPIDDSAPHDTDSNGKHNTYLHFNSMH